MMKTQIYQVIVPIVGIVGAAISLRQYRKGVYTFFETFLWICLWAFISLVAIFPDAISFFLSRTIGIKDHINAIIFIGLAISFFLNFVLFITIKKQNKTITDLVRKMAIDNYKQVNDHE